MLFSFTGASVLAFVLGAVALVIAGFVWMRRPAPGALPFTILMVAVAAWIFIRTFNIAAVDLPDKIFLFTFLYPVTTLVSILWLFFALDYTGYTWWKRPGYILLFLVVPVFTMTVLLTRQWQGWEWIVIEPDLGASGELVVWTHGPLFWLQVVYIASLFLTGFVLLWRFVLKSSGMSRWTMAMILLGAVFPIAGHGVIVLGISPAGGIDVTPFALIVTGIIYLLAIFRFRIFDIVPVARMALVENMPDGILVTDHEGCIVEINPVASRMAGCSRVSALGKPLEQIWLELDQLISQPYWGNNVETYFNKSGKILYCEVSVTPIRDGHGSVGGKLIVLRDVSERKRMQDQLIAQDRLASIGELTSGVAHELNNPLSIVAGFSELLLKRELPPDIESDLSIISSEIERASKIVDNLLTFARKQPEEKLPVEVNGIITGILEIRRYEQEVNNIQTVTNLAPDLPKVMGNDFQLRQAFMNIIINAEYFMQVKQGKGTLTITTGKSGDFVRISFTDDGLGIPRNNIEHLFDPFFTTKEVGKGTGLGLSICHGIVTEHGGKIWVESTLGEGSTFIVELPVHKPE